MDNNKNGLRRSGRSTVVIALGALVSACQSMPPVEEAPPATIAASPLEQIILPTLAYRDVVVESDHLTRLTSRIEWDIADDAAVQRERAWYARNQAYLDRVFTRGDLYLFHFVGEL